MRARHSKLKKAVNDLKFKMEKVSSPDVETNSKVCGPKEKDVIVPLEDLIVLNGSLEGKIVRVLKDDGCNNNVVSHEPFGRNRRHFDWKKCNIDVKHSKSDTAENSSKEIIGATLKIGKHECD